MDEGSRGQFLNIDRALINIQEEIEDHSRILSDLCQHRTRSPPAQTKGESLGILNSFRISYSGGEGRRPIFHSI